MRTPAEPARDRPPPRDGRRPAPADSLAGILLEDRYRVGARLARGGMSTVYRGLDLRLDRPVAIKVMTPQYAADPTFLVRFEREARAAARLDNPHVVGVYDQGRDGEHVFLVMELVDGGTLRDLLHQRGALSVPVALSVLEPVLGALAAAHAAGLVHRDVKPENVLISARGEVKVADFGLVRAVTSTTMATGNVILGTVAYLSPEQVATGAADERSDVYSAGIVGYEMLTGNPPFGGDNPLSVAYQHVHSDVPPVADAAPGVPVGVAAAIDAATSRDPLDRPSNAAELLRRLRAAREQLGLSLVPVPVPRPPRARGTGGGGANRSAPGPARHGVRHPTTPPGTVGRGGAGDPGPAAGPGGPGAETAAMDSAARAATRVHRDPAAHPTEVAGLGTAPAGRPDRLTAAERPGDVPPGRGRLRTRHTDRLSRSRKRWRTRLIVLAIVLLVAGAAAFGGWWLGGRWTSTPSVLGDPGDGAVAAVRDAGLVPAVTTRHDNATPSGEVASVQPRAGTRQLRGATVSLAVSSGRPVVPRIDAGITVQAASSLVRAADLTPVTDPAVDVYDNAVPAGAVVRTDPAGGRPADIGARVLLVRSRGPVPELVPTVAGKLPEDARNKLLVAGFTIGPPKTAFAPDQPAGTVLGTAPPAGRTAPHGSPVSLVLAVSKTVPDVAGTEVQQAAGRLRKDGFTVTVGDPVFDGSVPGGQVVRSDPAAGARIDPSDPAVTLIPSSAVTVPALTGMSVREAVASLAGLGLADQVYSLFGGDSATVTGQQPDPGTLVEPGSTVQLSAWP